MKLYNTRTRSLEELKPLQDNLIRIYSCGPTVYDHAHIGNLATYIFADTLRRTIRMMGYEVKHGMNYTDVDDKTIRRSKEKYPTKKPEDALRTLTDNYIHLFLDDMQKIGNDVKALLFLRATEPEVIGGMQQLIVKLHNSGFAYIADDGVYFSIDAYRKSGKVYGQLLELTLANTSEERIQNDEYDKESAHDFALWKKKKAGEPSWSFTLDGHDLSGRPGWHIECSAMSRQLLGQPFDIHTGGVDNIFPHHENEIAQSTATEKDPVLATFFLHAEHMLVDSAKMSKSANNFYTLQDITQKNYDPLAFRLLVLQSHYRSQKQFSWENLTAAQNRLQDLRAMAALRWQTLPRAASAPSFAMNSVSPTLLDMLAQDLNTPQALAFLSEIATELVVLGVSEENAATFDAMLQGIDQLFGLRLCDVADITDQQKHLLHERETARDRREWAKADELRDKLHEQGIGIRDTSSGSAWYRL